MNAQIRRRLKAQHVVVAALLVCLAGCSSSASTTAQNATAATGTADGSTAVTSSSDTSTSASTTTGAAKPNRPDDACTLLTSDQVAAAVGTPGPYNDSHEDPADDGTPVWGCTWGTHTSNADIREVPASDFESMPDPADITTSPVTGIGDKARMETTNPDGRNPDIYFTVGGAYYDLSVVLSRSETGAENAAKEEIAERTLGKLLAAKLAS
jgi:hypothetical protein